MIEKTIYATLEFIDVELLLNSSTVHSTEDAELYFGTFYKGDQGDKGDTGAKVVSTELIGQDAQGGNIYRQAFDDGTIAEFTAPKGAKGDDGEPGLPGTTDYNELQNKPTKLSDFENDSDFVTPAYHDATKQDVITDLATIRSGAAAGATAVQPRAISDMETRTHAADTYVAKESGKGLSSNDYTTAEKSKLAGIETGAQKNPTAVSHQYYRESTTAATISVVATLTGGRDDDRWHCRQLTQQR